MNRLLLFLFLCASAFAGNADIDTITIEPNGWVAEVAITGLSTNGSFSSGLGANNTLTGNEKLKITLNSCGYNDDGSTNATSRTLYGTLTNRFAYPNNAYPDQVYSGSDVVVKIALSDYVYSSDVSLVADVASGLYTAQGTNSKSASSFSVVNNSTLIHPPCVANWSYPGFQRITNSTMTVKAIGFHRSGQHGRPLRAMKFTALDQHSVSNSVLVTGMSIDGTSPDPEKVCEYVGTISLAGMTDHDLIRVDFTAYPWIGDSAAVLSTTDGKNSSPPLYAPITNWLDLSFNTTVAVASYTNSGTGVVVTNFNPASPPVAFASIGAAANAIVKSNGLWRGTTTLSNMAGALIYVRAGDYQFSGATIVPGSEKVYSWVTVLPFPGDGAVNITNVASDNFLSKWYHLQNLNLLWTGGGTKVFFADGNVWSDGCTINHNGAAIYYTVVSKYFTWCTLSTWVSGITRPFSTVNAPTVLMRGNSITGTAETGIPYTYIGNVTTAAASSSDWASEYSSMAIPRPVGGIVAYNFLTHSGNLTPNAIWSVNPENTNGFALVQNIFEKTTSTTPLLQVSADSSTDTNTIGVIVWNNTIAGERINYAYNDHPDAATAHKRNRWSLINNVMDRFSIVSDKDLHGGGQDASRTNNWSEYNGVGYVGNVYASRAFIGDFAGLSAIDGGTTLGSYNIGWITNKSNTGSAAGFGNYRLRSDSQIGLLGTAWYLPFDIEGQYRGGFDPPGAYASASPRKGGGFFAP